MKPQERPKKAPRIEKPQNVGTKRKGGSLLSAPMEAAIQEKRRMIDTGRVEDDTASELANLEQQLNGLKVDLAACKGVEGILRAKVLCRRKTELEQKIAALKAPKPEQSDQAMHEYMAMIDRMERAATAEHKTAKIIPLENRLLPPKPTQRNILETMTTRDAEKWQNLRAHKKRYAVMYDKEHPKARTNLIDSCPDCVVDFVIDREMAIRVCPNCGRTEQFASHILEMKDGEKDDNATRQQSLNHMQKFSSQFERGHPTAPMDVLEALSVAYGKVHVHDPSKVQACRTSTLLKDLPGVPKSFKRAPDRLTKELKAEGIPEFSSQQILHLLNQRNRLRVPDDLTAEPKEPGTDEGGTTKKARKSFNNQIFVRHLGRSDHMEQARLFPNPKTARIHLERTRALEKECAGLGPPKTDAKAPPQQWALYPAS